MAFLKQCLTTLNGFWNDPVWSKVIAVIICAVWPFFWAYVLAWWVKNKAWLINGVILITLTPATAFFGYYYLNGYSGMMPPPFPRRDGLIADFTSGRGGPARTALGTQFSLLSDSAWNLHSKVWYERVDEETGSKSNGFLRIYYQLEPAYGHEPYVGVYTDFSFPPPSAYDVSHFRKLTMRLRSSDLVSSRPIMVAVVLYSTNVSNPDYAFATWQIPRHNLRQGWLPIRIALDDFSRPHFVNYDVTLDLKRIYRIALVISGQPDQPAHGYIDVDDLQFE